MSNTTSTSLNNTYGSYYVDKAIMTLYAETPLYDLGDKTPLPTGEGKQVVWNAWRPLANPSSTLAEGTANAAEQASSRQVTATVQQVGKAVTTTDLIQYVSSLKVREGVQMLIRENAKVAMEFTCHMGIFKNTFRGGYATSAVLSGFMSAVASAFSANTGTISTSNRQFQFPVVFGPSVGKLSAVSKTAPTRSALFSLYSIRKATRRLRVKNAKPFADGKFRGYTHPNCIHMLKADPAFLAWNSSQYASQTMHAGEVLSTDGVRWLESTHCPRYAATAHSVNLSFIWGQGAWGVTEALGGLEIYVISGPDSGNLFNQLATVSYKLTAIAACLNPSAGVILATHELL